ncbi:MAG: hypothetical protein ACOCQD_02955 [archaeon]
MDSNLFLRDINVSRDTFEKIPAELKEYNQWVLWKLEENGDGKPIKMPYSVDGTKAKTSDSDTWSSFEEVYRIYSKFSDNYTGIGFVFSENDPFMGVDYDHVIDTDNGEIEPEILEEVKRLGSYSEVSYSGDGLHVIVKGSVPGERNKKEPREMYDRSRFFVVTGQHLESTPFEITEPSNDVINSIYSKIDPSKDSVSIQDSKKIASKNLSYTDEEIVNRCMENDRTGKFEALYNGYWEDKYESQSQAEMALCNYLAMQTDDEEQIKNIIENSGLYRKKWDREDYKEMTINKAIEENEETRIKNMTKNDNQKVSTVKKPYVITDNEIYLSVIDEKENYSFAHLDNNNQIVYSNYLNFDGKFIYPQELPLSSNNEYVPTVGIPSKEAVDIAETMDANELFKKIKNHFYKYIDAPVLDIEMFSYFVLFTWFYKKLNTTPYLRFIADTGKGKSRMLNVVSDLCFYPVSANGASSPSAAVRTSEKWHGTLKVDESDIAGGKENGFIKYLNLGFETGNYIFKTDIKDYSKQEVFDPFCPKVIAMREPFKDNATEARCLSFTPKETRRDDIPLNLPGRYHEEMKELRGAIARLVLYNWSNVDGDNHMDYNHMDIEPRLKQIIIPLSIVSQLMPEGEKRIEDYLGCRQKEIKKDRSESFEGTLFNYVYSLALGENLPPKDFVGEFTTDDEILAITPKMVAENFNISGKKATDTLKSIGMRSEQTYIKILQPDGETVRKKIRKYVVPDGDVWNEIIVRYYYDDSGDQMDTSECPDVLKAKDFNFN